LWGTKLGGAIAINMLEDDSALSGRDLTELDISYKLLLIAFNDRRALNTRKRWQHQPRRAFRNYLQLNSLVDVGNVVIVMRSKVDYRRMYSMMSREIPKLVDSLAWILIRVDRTGPNVHR